MFGDEWPAERAFPTEVVADGETIELGDIALTVTDLGPSRVARRLDLGADATSRARVLRRLAYDRTHCYLADGFREQWLANIAPAARRARARHDAAPRPRRAGRARGARLAAGATSRPCSRAIRTPGASRRDDASLPAVRDARVPDGAQRRAAAQRTRISVSPSVSTSPRRRRARRDGAAVEQRAVAGAEVADQAHPGPDRDLGVAARDGVVVGEHDVAVRAAAEHPAAAFARAATRCRRRRARAHRGRA